MSPRSDAFYQIASKSQRISEMLNGMKGADDVVFFGVGCSVLGNRLVSDVGIGSRRVGMRFEADIGCMWQIRRQRGFATADVENLLPCSNQLGEASEFGPGDAGDTQRAVKVRAPVEVLIEGVVS